MDWKLLQEEQREWSLQNFGPHSPDQPQLGMIEEIGELAHAHLKQLQGIRGTPEEHYASKVDAIADTMIFLADFCTCKDWDLEPEVSIAKLSVSPYDVFTPEECIRQAVVYAANHNPRSLVRWLLRYAVLEGIDLESATFATWEQVKQRNWKANATTGAAA